MDLSLYHLPQPTARSPAELRSFHFFPDISYNEPLYFMYRDVAKHEQDRPWLEFHTLRYDITVIPPADLGGEYVKTKGHYPPENPAGVGYPEIYEVLEGRAHFLLQKKTLDDIVLVQVRAGDIAGIPPGYGHVTINPSPLETLILANLVSTRLKKRIRGVREPPWRSIVRTGGGETGEKSPIPAEPGDPYCHR